MTKTLTTEAMQEIYEAAVHVEATLGDPDAEFDLYCKLDDVGGVDVTIRKLIDMVRAANREAQPVAVTDEMALAFHRALNDGGIGESDLEEIKAGLRGALCNITAPPAPAVPDAIEPTYEAIKAILPTANPDEYACCIGADMWNACRAAMLAQPVSQGGKLDSLNIRAVSALREAVRNQWLKSNEFAEKVYWHNMHSIANEIIEAMAAAPEGGNGA
ncbi:hypothetical protein [Serratia proteamaculans]